MLETIQFHRLGALRMTTLKLIAAFALATFLTACGYPLVQNSLVVSSIPDDERPIAPIVCNSRHTEGQHVIVLRACDGIFYFLPYEISSDAFRNLETNSLVLRNNRTSVFLIDLSISDEARQELLAYSSRLGYRRIPAYPLMNTVLVPATSFSDATKFSITIKDNNSSADQELSRTMIVQVVGASNIDTFQSLLATTNAITVLEYVDIPLSNGSTERVSIQLRAGNLTPTNLSR